MRAKSCLAKSDAVTSIYQSESTGATVAYQFVRAAEASEPFAIGRRRRHTIGVLDQREGKPSLCCKQPAQVIKHFLIRFIECSRVEDFLGRLKGDGIYDWLKSFGCQHPLRSRQFHRWSVELAGCPAEQMASTVLRMSKDIVDGLIVPLRIPEVRVPLSC